MSINVTSSHWRTSSGIAEGSCVGAAPAGDCWWVVESAPVVAAMGGSLMVILRRDGGDFATSQYEGVEGRCGTRGEVIV